MWSNLRIRLSTRAHELMAEIEAIFSKKIHEPIYSVAHRGKERSGFASSYFSLRIHFPEKQEKNNHEPHNHMTFVRI